MLHSSLPPNLTTKPNLNSQWYRELAINFFFSCGKRILHQ